MNKWVKQIPFGGALALAIGVVAVFVFSENVRESAIDLLEWFQDMGSWGLLIYIGFYSLIVIFLVPGVIFTLGAGFVFGFWLGAPVILISFAIGSTTAFLLARYALGAKVSRKLNRHPRLTQLNKGLRQEGWKIVMLSRLVPGFPSKLSNYFFGVTSISLKGFFWGNLVGLIPITIINVYIGSLAAELTELIERDREPWEWILYAIGFGAAIGLAYYLWRIARRSIRRAIEADDREEDRKHREAGDQKSTVGLNPQ